MSMPINEFLEMRISEDEVLARAAQGVRHASSIAAGAGHWRVDWTGTRFPDKAAADHAARYDPARVLAECASKRALVKQVSDVAWGGYAVRDVVLEALAAVYADHPDYQSGWAL